MSLKKKIVLVFFVILILVALNKFAQAGLRNIVFKISQPPQKFFWALSQNFSGFLEGLFRAQSLKTENTILAEQNRLILKKLIELESLKKENEALRKALNLGLEKKFQLILAELQGREGEYDFIVLNKGENDGVLPEAAVITEEGVLVGKVVMVFKNFSKVQLISNKGFAFAIEIPSEKGPVLGRAQGRGNGEITVNFLPLAAELKKGSMAFTTTFTLRDSPATEAVPLPRNLLVGEVKEVKKSSLEPFQEVVVETFFKDTLPQTLFIIKNKL